MTLRRIARMLLLGIGAWAVLAAIGSVVFGRALHNADHMDRPREPLVPQLDDPLRRVGAVRGPFPAWSPEPPGHSGAAGAAILALTQATNEATARRWLAVCARRGVAQPTLDELWRQWQTEHPTPENPR
jgi:hypothetical protein